MKFISISVFFTSVALTIKSQNVKTTDYFINLLSQLIRKYLLLVTGHVKQNRDGNVGEDKNSVNKRYLNPRSLNSYVTNRRFNLPKKD